MINSITIAGYLGQDPEYKVTESGKTLCNCSVAVRKVSGGTESTLWLRVTLWNGAAEFAHRYLHKGSYVVVNGWLDIQEYTGKDGIERKVAVVQGNTIESPKVGVKGETTVADTGNGSKDAVAVAVAEDIPF